jgi:hypothetical protein
MGLQMSNLNALIAGETMNLQYDIYKIIDLYENKQDNEYFKVEDLLDFNLKFTKRKFFLFVAAKVK